MQIVNARAGGRRGWLGDLLKTAWLVACCMVVDSVVWKPRRSHSWIELDESLSGSEEIVFKHHATHNESKKALTDVIMSWQYSTNAHHSAACVKKKGHQTKRHLVVLHASWMDKTNTTPSSVAERYSDSTTHPSQRHSRHSIHPRHDHLSAHPCAQLPAKRTAAFPTHTLD